MSSAEWSQEQKDAFLSWADGNVIEFRKIGDEAFSVANDSVIFSKDYEYRIKVKKSHTGGADAVFKRRGNFRFRWKDELNSWLNGETVRFYDDKKKEWHTLMEDSHVWDCITIYDTAPTSK